MAKRTTKRNDVARPSDPRQKQLIEFRRKKRDLLALIPAMWKALTDDKGKLDLPTLTERVAKKINEDGILNEYELAKELVESVDRRMRPTGEKNEQGTLSFYDPEAYIPTARRERRRMDMATRDDVAAWQEIDTVEFEASRVAYQGKTEWRFRLMAAWREGETLAEVMSRIDRENAKGGVA